MRPPEKRWRHSWTLFLLFSLVACSPPADHQEASTFRYNMVNGVSSLDPAFARNQANMWAVHHLYSGLLQFDSTLNILPSIARSWEISESGQMYTFHLRPDVYFHDHPIFPQGKGRKVLASDFVYSFNRLLDPATASPGAWIFNGRVADESPFLAPDDSTFIIRLKSPFVPLLGILTMQYCSVIPHEAVEKYGRDFRSHPVGTGPFMMERWEEGEALILKRNPRYFEEINGQKLPYLEKVIISFNANKSMEFLEFMDGQLDFVSDIDASIQDLILDYNGNLRPKYRDKIRLLRSDYLNTEYFGFLMDSTLPSAATSPARFREVRQAVNMGFDREEMLRYLRNNKGTPAFRGMLPKGLPSYREDARYGYRYLPDSAKKLLRKRGYGPENPAELIISTPPTHVDICEYLQHRLAEVGIRLQIDVNSYGILYRKIVEGEASFFRGSWIADYPDGESYMALFYSKHGAPPNYTRFSNPVFDRWYEQAVGTTDNAKRHRMYRAMDSLMMEQAPVVPLYYDEVYRFVRPEVHGMQVNPMNLLDLRSVRKVLN